MSEELSCARSPVSCKVCKSKPVCQIYKRWKKCEEALESWMSKEAKEFASMSRV